MSFNLKQLTKEQKILLAALLIAAVATIYYFVSGQKSYDQNVRELQSSDPQVEVITEKTGPEGQKDLEVKCQDGSSYEIYYPPGEGNYDSLSASKCQPPVN
jgi:cell division protein FtsL